MCTLENIPVFFFKFICSERFWHNGKILYPRNARIRIQCTNHLEYIRVKILLKQKQSYLYKKYIIGNLVGSGLFS